MGEDVGFRIRIRALEAGITYLSYPLCLCVCVCARSLPAALAVLFALPLRGPYVVAYKGGICIPLSSLFIKSLCFLLLCCLSPLLFPI